MPPDDTECEFPPECLIFEVKPGNGTGWMSQVRNGDIVEAMDVGTLSGKPPREMGGEFLEHPAEVIFCFGFLDCRLLSWSYS